MASSSVPKTMKGIQISKNGGTEVLEYREDLPVPEPKDGEILVKNDFIGINFIDTYFRSGLYAAPSFPYILGREGAGTVVATGSGVNFKSGDKAVYIAPHTYAEYAVALDTHSYPVPNSLDTKTAAAGLLQGLTAITLIREAHYVKKDEWVLVHAAAGGMGLWLCQLLRAVGANVIGTASTPEKRSLAERYGAKVTLEYAESMGHDKFVEKVRELTGDPGPTAVFDGVGKATFDVSLDCVARKGSMISFGNASGAVPPFSIARLATKNVKLLRPTLFNYTTTREEFEHWTKELFDIMEKNKIDVNIHKVYEMKDIKQVHEDLEGRKTTGKLVMKP